MKNPIPSVTKLLPALTVLAFCFWTADSTQAAVTLTDTGNTAPTPGANDVSQLSDTGDTGNPNSKNYYSNNNSSSRAVPPGQQFTTPTGSPSYTLTDIYVQTGNGSGNGIGGSTPYTLFIYSISGTHAALVASYPGLTTGTALNNSSNPGVGDWLHFSGLSLTLSQNSTYAYAISTGGNGGGPYTGLANSTASLTGGTAVLIATNLTSGVGTVTTVSGFNGVFDVVLTPAAVTLADNGSTAPTPGGDDISQLSTTGDTGNPSPIGNYYSNGNSTGTPVPPGEKFTTGSNAGGYTLTDVYVQAGNGNGNSIGSYTPYILYLYSVSGSTATLLTNYAGLMTGSALNNTTPGDWLHFSSLSISLNPNQTYAFTVATPSGLLGGGGPYTGIENSTASLSGASAVVINNSSGAITAASGANAVFDLGLTANSGPGTPTGLMATPGNNQVMLSWTAPGGAVTGYNVYRSTTSGSGYIILAVGTNVSSSPFTDTTAVNGTTYYYVVTALNGALESSYSAQAGATPPRANEAVAWNGIQASDNNWTLSTSEGNWLGASTTFYENGDAATFDDNSSSGAQTVNLNVTVKPASLAFANTNVNYTISGSGAISGTTGLANNGTGTVTLSESGGDNFSGGISVNNGTLILDNANSAITGGGTIATGAILQVGNGDGNGALPTGNVTNNSTLIFNQGANAPVTAAISGSGNLIQTGGDTVQLAGNNSFTGTVTVTNNSTLKLGSASALGATNGATIIANGSTLDLNGAQGTPLINEPVIVLGSGNGGNGAIVNNGGSDPTLNAMTLAGDTTIGGSGRWDIGGTLSSGGNPYNVTITGGAYHEWNNLSVDTNLANITVAGSATLGDKGTTKLGNPTNILKISSGATLQFWNNGAANVTLSKHLQVDGSGMVVNGFGATTIAGPVTLGSGYCSFDVAAGTLTLNGALDGSGVLYENTDPGTIIVNSNSPSFTGGAYVLVGKLVINGNFGPGSVTTLAGTTLAGTGTLGGPADVDGALLPGDQGVAGTFTAAGGLTLESDATVTNDLSATIAGNNDLIAVTGDVTASGNIIVLNPIGGTLQNGIYPLITYTGSFSGGFSGVQTVSPSSYTLTLTNITTTTPKQIAVIVGGNPSLLLWNNASGNSEWDVAGSFNWSNVLSHASEQFVNADTVILDDSITNAATPGTNIDIAGGQVVIPAVITNNSTVDYTIGGAGKISGGASIVKTGDGTLTFTNANDFTGDIYVSSGILRGWTAGNFGATNGTITVTNGATLDRGWDAVKAIVVSGSGVGGNGAIVNNSSGNAIYDGSGGLTRSITLAGDTTFGGNTRWDLGGSSGAAINCLGGSNYNLTINEASGVYMEWDNVTIDTNLGNIDIYTTGGGSLGIKGSGASLGNPTNIITVHPNSELTFWGETSGNSGYAKKIHVMTGGIVDFRPQHADVYYNSALILDDGANVNFFNGSGAIATAMLQPVELDGLAHLQVGDSAVTFSNVISGTGGFYWDNYNNTLVFTATNTYQGITDIRSGRVLALKDNGSISGSTNILLGSGATLSVSARNDQTLTLAAGQTLQGIGSIAGNLTAGPGANVSPAGAGVTGILTVTNNAVLSGNASMDLNQSLSTNDVLRAANLTYGGTLSLNNIAGTLAANEQFKLFNAGTYGGAFTNIVPANPNNDSSLAWDTNNLVINGTLKIVSAVVQHPVITGIGLSGTTLTISATNGSNGGQFVLLESTNVSLPLNQWLPVLTNNFDGGGNLNLSTNIVDPNNAQQFYILSQ